MKPTPTPTLPTPTRGFFIGALAMALVLTAANFLVRFPINDWLTWAALCYPLIYLVCDCINRFYGPEKACQVVAAGFAVGLPMSFAAVYLDTENFGIALRIAGASGAAYVVSQFVDVHVFHILRERAWWRAPMMSSIVSSVIDAMIFFPIAFAGTGILWGELMLGNLAAKAIMLIVLLPPYRALTRRLPAWREWA